MSNKEDKLHVKPHKEYHNFSSSNECYIDPAELNDPFQKVIEQAGSHGRYQLIYNLTFVMSLAMAGSLIYMNIILALNIPDHWCTVPGREKTNFTLEQWRNITLPTATDNRGLTKYSSCQMYELNDTFTETWQTWVEADRRNASVTTCTHGWSYDRTWYVSTIPTEENWVCEKDLFVTNVFVVSRITEVIGSFILGQMGDIFGRRVVYYISVICCAASRMISICTTSSYTWFLITSGLAGFTINSIFQSPQIIGMEISREEDRSTIAIYSSFGWSIGTTLMPLVFWWLREWRPFMWITTMPTAIILLFSYYVIESPRWLISKRRYAEAILQFKKIAKINGRTFDMSAKELAKLYEKQITEATYGIASLFNGWRLARNTTIVGFSWCVVAVSYFTLVLFSSRMGGNPFLNFLLQSIVEIPAYIIAKYIGDNYGRRFTTSSSFFVSFLTCLPIFVLATDAEYENVIIGLASFIKFLNAITFFTCSLQCMEIYPTCMRQTGISLGTILANAIGVAAPYLVYLGTTVDIRAPYYILGVLFLLGSIASSFLPETLHKKLPDTMDEARHFGKHDKFFSLPKPPPKVNSNEMASEKLNQPQFAP